MHGFYSMLTIKTRSQSYNSNKIVFLVKIYHCALENAVYVTEI